MQPPAVLGILSRSSPAHAAEHAIPTTRLSSWHGSPEAFCIQLVAEAWSVAGIIDCGLTACIVAAA